MKHFSFLILTLFTCYSVVGQATGKAEGANNRDYVIKSVPYGMASEAIIKIKGSPVSGEGGGISLNAGQGAFGTGKINFSGSQFKFYLDNDGINDSKVFFKADPFSPVKFGIGTENPTAKLHVNNGNNSYGTILANATETPFSLYAKTLTTQPADIESFRLGLKYNTDENNGFISFYRGQSTSGGFLGFSTNGEERIRISRDGNVGIGTSGPSSKLHLQDNTVRVWKDHLKITSESDQYGIAFAGRGHHRGGIYADNSGEATGKGNITVWARNGGNVNLNPDGGNVGIGTANGINSKLRVHLSGSSEASFPTTRSKGDLVGMFTASNNGLEIGVSKKHNDRKAWILARHSSDGYAEHYSTLHIQPNLESARYKGVMIGFKPNESLPVGSPELAIKGNVCIGSREYHPDFKLSVNGKVQAKEIKVHTGWSDFVFYDDYKLPTLKEVETHIQEKGHLKDIPSAAVVAREGIFLGEMNSKLLQKIEELTLYTIAQEKKISALEENKNAEVKELKENSKIQDQKIELLLKRLEQLEASK